MRVNDREGSTWARKSRLVVESSRSPVRSVRKFTEATACRFRLPNAKTPGATRRWSRAPSLSSE